MSRCFVRCFVFLLLLGIAPSASAQALRYTIDDLQTLSKAQRWAELLEHLEDIRPKARDARWKALLLRAASGWLAQPEIAADPLRASQLAEALLRRHPELSADAALMKRRAEVGLQAHERCLALPRLAQDCERSLRRFVVQKGTGAGAIHRAGKLVGRQMAAHFGTFYFRHAVVGQPDAEKDDVARRCTDPDLARAVVSALTDLRASSESADHAKAIGLGPCWPQLKRELLDALVANARAQELLCSALLARNALSGVRKKKCTRLTTHSASEKR